MAVLANEEERARGNMEEYVAEQTDNQHGQAGSAGAPPKFCSAALRKTSAVPGNVSQNRFAHLANVLRLVSPLYSSQSDIV